MMAILFGPPIDDLGVATGAEENRRARSTRLRTSGSLRRRYS
jgi:hypothetical protein